MSKTFFTGAQLNRLSYKRGESLLNEFESISKFVLFHNTRHLSKEGKVHWLSTKELTLSASLQSTPKNMVFLGLDEVKNVAYWALDVTQDKELSESTRFDDTIHFKRIAIGWERIH